MAELDLAYDARPTVLARYIQAVRDSRDRLARVWSILTTRARTSQLPSNSASGN